MMLKHFDRWNLLDLVNTLISLSFTTIDRFIYPSSAIYIVLYKSPGSLVIFKDNIDCSTIILERDEFKLSLLSI